MSANKPCLKVFILPENLQEKINLNNVVLKICGSTRLIEVKNVNQTNNGQNKTNTEVMLFNEIFYV